MSINREVLILDSINILLVFIIGFLILIAVSGPIILIMFLIKECINYVVYIKRSSLIPESNKPDMGVRVIYGACAIIAGLMFLCGCTAWLSVWVWAGFVA